MYGEDQIKLYYLYMLADGEASEREKELFSSICEELYYDSFEVEWIIEQCEKIPSDGIFEEIKKLAGVPAEKTDDVEQESLIPSIVSIALRKFDNSENHATVLWNLINIGYADTKYTSEEREIVDCLKKHWKIPDDLYQEMIDVAETCLALEEHKKWVESLEEPAYKEEKIEQIKKDIKMTLDGMKMTLDEMDF